MKSRLPLFRIPRCLSGLLLFCGTGLLVTASGHAATSPLAWEDLQFQMNQHVNWWRIYLETEVQVFDPLQAVADAKGKLHPVERPDRRYRQRIHWKADEAIIVESLGFQKRLHIHLEYKDNYADTALHPGFDWHETSPWYLRLLGRDSQNREQTLREYGLSGFHVTLQLTEDSHALYRVGHPESGAYAFIQPITFRMHSLHREVQHPDGTVWQLEVRFSKFKTYQKQAYPQVTEYLFDGRLHKRVTVTKMESLHRIPVTARSTELQPFSQTMTSLALDHAR